MSYYGMDTECDVRLKRENERLQRDLEDQRYEEERRREREDREREDARRQREYERQEAMCSASTWEEAFCKGHAKYAQEARAEARDNAEIAAHVQADPTIAADPLYQPTTYFQDAVGHVERARTLYAEEMASVEAEIARLRQAALARVADRLDVEIPDNCISQGLREDNPSSLVDW